MVKVLSIRFLCGHFSTIQRTIKEFTKINKNNSFYREILYSRHYKKVISSKCMINMYFHEIKNKTLPVDTAFWGYLPY